MSEEKNLESSQGDNKEKSSQKEKKDHARRRVRHRNRSRHKMISQSLRSDLKNKVQDVAKDSSTEEKKKSYLEILQEESKKYEEIQKKAEQEGGALNEEEVEALEEGVFEEAEKDMAALAEMGAMNQIDDEVVDSFIEGTDEPLFDPEKPLNNTKGKAAAEIGGKSDVLRTKAHLKKSRSKKEGEVYSGNEKIEKGKESEGHVIKPQAVVSEKVNDKDSNLSPSSIKNAVYEGRQQIQEVLEKKKGAEARAAFFDDLKQALSYAGINASYIKGFCGVVLVLVIALTFFFSGGAGRIMEFISSFELPSFENVETPEEDTSKPTPSSSVPSSSWALDTTFLAGAREASSQRYLSYPLQLSYYFGEPVSLGDSKRHFGLITSLVTGESDAVSEDDRFAYFVDYSGQLRNMYVTDLTELLDNSTRRAATLAAHLRQLKEMTQKGKEIFEEIVFRAEKARVAFQEVTAEKNALEDQFFQAVEQYEGRLSDEVLSQFVFYAEKQVEFRAHYNALQKVAELYEILLERLDSRIKAIELNRDALVKGVKVIVVPGANLDLIVEDK